MGSFQSTNSGGDTQISPRRDHHVAGMEKEFSGVDLKRGQGARNSLYHGGQVVRGSESAYTHNSSLRPPPHQQPRHPTNHYPSPHSRSHSRGGAMPMSPQMLYQADGTHYQHHDRTKYQQFQSPQPMRQSMQSYQSSPASSVSSYGRSPVASYSRSPPQPVASPARGKTGGAYPKGTCDKCDGPHLTDTCPIYKKKKEDHPDAWRNFGRKTPLGMGASGGNFKLKNATVKPQPGDGSCLFHSLAYGLADGHSASQLRREIAQFVANNPNLEIAETPMHEWVKWDSGTSVSNYARSMSVSGWGGGIEMAACSHLKRVNVHVYEKRTLLGGFKRISCFDVPGARKTIHVLYRGSVHYDALVPGRN